MDSWKLPLQVRSKYYLREEKLSRQKKGSQTKLLTGMCTVALYWFYIQVSLRILSGACKCEIGKRHCRNAGGPGDGRRKEKGRKVRKVSPRCARTRHQAGEQTDFKVQCSFTQIYCWIHALIWLYKHALHSPASVFLLKPCSSVWNSNS